METKGVQPRRRAAVFGREDGRDPGVLMTVFRGLRNPINGVRSLHACISVDPSSRCLHTHGVAVFILGAAPLDASGSTVPLQPCSGCNIHSKARVFSMIALYIKTSLMTLSFARDRAAFA